MRNIIICSLFIFLVVFLARGHVAANNQLEEFFSFVEQQQQRNWEIEDKKVMAFYYPWYRSKDFSDRWIHWKNVDEKNQEISNSANYPQLGAYDSLDEEVVTTHFKQASEVGIDTFIVSWWGPSTPSDNAINLILEKAQEYDISIALYYEKNPKETVDGRIKKGYEDFTYILDEYTDHPAYLKVAEKPVLFIYGRAMNEVALNEWGKIINKVREEEEKDFQIIVDNQDEFTVSIFDGLHTYNIAASIKSLSLEQIDKFTQKNFEQMVNIANSYNKISTVTIIPAYDDTKIREPGINVPRREGQLYSTLWENAIKANPDWILITSWNEWHEGSEIEPSIEYGEKYLDITKNYSKKFKEKTAEKTKEEKVETNIKEKKQIIKDHYQDTKVGIIGEEINSVVYKLWNLGLEVELVSYEEFVEQKISEDDYQILVYVGGEHYTQTVNETGDVDDTIKEYLQSGGTFIAAPNAPFPFFYNEKDETVRQANKLGFSIHINEVSTDKEPVFRYHEDIVKQLEIETTEISFPVAGDTRWRPSFKRGAAVFGATYTPLLSLYDGNENLGDGISVIEHEDNKYSPGKTVYIWFRLLDGQTGYQSLYNVFRFLIKT
ncbi:MAG: glycoside hydrolase family 99-like domain-containing protein [bacterium]